MVELRIERENRIARLYFIQGICVEKRDRIWIADVLLKEVRLRDNTKKTLNNQIDSFVKLNDEYSTQEQKVESLSHRYCHDSLTLSAQP